MEKSHNGNNKDENDIGKGTNGQKAKTSEAKAASSKQSSKKVYLWIIKITIIAFILSVAFSFFAEFATSGGNLVVSILLLLLLIVANIIFDCIGVAVAACDITPISAMASKKLKGSKMAVKLLQNAEKVSCICCDVIGDICGIISGASSVALVVFVIENFALSKYEMWFSIAVSSVVASLTIGGKAYMKNLALIKSKDIVMMTARFLSLFTSENRKRRKKEKRKLEAAQNKANKQETDVSK